jgi:proline iminopeptidase
MQDIDLDAAEAPAASAIEAPEQRLAPGSHAVQLDPDDGLILRYTVAGSGPVVVAQAPGWGIGAGYLRNGLTVLESHFTMVYLDPRGNGASTRPDNQHAMATVDMANDLERLRQYWSIDSLRLLGHSSAGAVAIAYAARHPGKVARLLLVDSDLLGFDSGPSFKKFAAERRDDPLYSAALARLMSAKPTSDEEFADLLLGTLPYYFSDPVANVPRLLRTMSDSPSLWAYGAYNGADRDARTDQQGSLAAVHAPTLVLVGRADAFCGTAIAQRIASGIDGALLQVFERSGHFPWIEQPKAFFEAAIGFLAD